MKTLFSRILLAQVVAVVLALTVVTLITRASLNQGFKQFLDRQESTVLENLAPALADFYQRQEGWDLLRENPDQWQRSWRITRANAGGPRQHCHVGVVTAGMHSVRVLRSEGQARFFRHWQCVHVAAQQESPPRSTASPPTARTALSMTSWSTCRIASSAIRRRPRPAT